MMMMMMMMIIFMTTMVMTADDGDDSDKLMTNGMNSNQKLRIPMFLELVWQEQLPKDSVFLYE